MIWVFAILTMVAWVAACVLSVHYVWVGLLWVINWAETEIQRLNDLSAELKKGP